MSNIVPEGFFDQTGKDLALPVPQEELERQIQEFAQDGMREEMEGLPTEYSTIKLLHAGVAQFHFVQEDEAIKQFEGIIVHVDKSRLWWKHKYGQAPENGDSWPECFSRDLLVPAPESRDPQAEKCATCPQNQWGSATTQDGKPARGKACNEVRRLFVIPAGKLTPYCLTVPPTSLKPLSRYFQLLVNRKIGKPQFVTTIFKAVNVENRDGIVYSELALEPGRKVPPAWIYQVLDFKRQIERMISSAKPMSQEEYMQ